MTQSDTHPDQFPGSGASPAAFASAADPSPAATPAPAGAAPAGASSAGAAPAADSRTDASSGDGPAVDASTTGSQRRPGELAGERAGEELLRLSGVRKYFALGRAPWQKSVSVKAVDGVDLVVRRGETVGLVGESGSGKSTLARVATRLLDPTEGRVEIGGRDVTRVRGRRLRPVRRKIQLVFQDPQASLNPRQSVGAILTTPFRAQGIRPTRAQLAELLHQVGLADEHLERYPHEFSGGQRQRIGIARALSVKPDLLVCDEPVSALDVSVQAQVLNLLADLRDELGLSYILVAHDLAVVRQVADRVAVMYLGTIVEEGPAAAVYSAPAHPYTRALLSAVPVPEPGAVRERIVLSGDVPTPISPPSGCPFRTRCYQAEDVCATTRPVLEPVPGDESGAHRAACYFPETSALPTLREDLR